MSKNYFFAFIFFFLFSCFSFAKEEVRCGIENCHGLEITCGSNLPQACTSMYALGDNCRQYAECQVIDGNCQFVPNQKFDDCKSCVDQCLKNFKNDLLHSFPCADECFQNIENNSE